MSKFLRMQPLSAKYFSKLIFATVCINLSHLLLLPYKMLANELIEKYRKMYANYLSFMQIGSTFGIEKKRKSLAKNNYLFAGEFFFYFMYE